MYRCLVILCLGILFSNRGITQQSVSHPSDTMPLPLPSLSTPASLHRPSWKFRSAEYVGMLFGQQGQFGQFQTVNGLCKGPWFLALGVGLDYYQLRSLPVFLSVTRDLMKSGSGFFVTVDGGPHFPLSHKPQYGLYGTSHYAAGPYYSTGLGYKLKLSARRDHALSLSTAYSYKEFKEKLKDDPQNSQYNYRDRRWSLKIGLIL